MDLWDIHQQMSIRNLRRHMATHDSAIAATRARDTMRTDTLEDRFERLLLTVEAMWRLLSEYSGMSDEALLAKITELDETDGRLDGQRGKDRVECNSCGAAVSREFARCLYCGTDAEIADAFQRF